jgi:hypothetical protein
VDVLDSIPRTKEKKKDTRKQKSTLQAEISFWSKRAFI